MSSGKKITTTIDKLNMGLLGATLSGFGKASLPDLHKSILSSPLVKKFKEFPIRLFFSLNKKNSVVCTVKTPTTTSLIKHFANESTISYENIVKIAEIKIIDHNTKKLESIISTIIATAKTCHIKVLQ